MKIFKSVLGLLLALCIALTLLSGCGPATSGEKDSNDRLNDFEGVNVPEQENEQNDDIEPDTEPEVLKSLSI